ncbi:MAG: DUF3179 domain-containing protein [Candidatus Kariarchaeaceae archaeon]
MIISTVNIQGSDHTTTTRSDLPKGDWLVPTGLIAGPLGKDWIPSIDEPKFLEADDPNAPTMYQEVLGIVIDGIARAYPYDILNWHEIVNDEINDKHFSVTYCPLTGTGILYRTQSIDSTTFGTSGKLYENNLIMYDRNTGSYWSQMLGKSIKGMDSGLELEKGIVMETYWGIWKEMYPDTVILSRETGFNRDYNRTPYVGYWLSESINFVSSYNGEIKPYSLYHPKELTTIVSSGDQVKLLPFKELQKYKVLNHELAGKNFVTIYDEKFRLSVTYNAKTVNGTSLTFSSNNTVDIQENTYGSFTYRDVSGSVWNIRGQALSGIYKGDQLIQEPTYNAYWFSAITMFPVGRIFNETFTSFENSSTYYHENDTRYSINQIVPDESFLEFSQIYVVYFVIFSLAIYKRRKRKSIPL